MKATKTQPECRGPKALTFVALVLSLALLTPSQAQASFQTLHCFDHTGPTAALVQARNGDLYGATPDGGDRGFGSIFRVTTNGEFTLLYSFTGGADGATPNGIIVGPDGGLYGTTRYGGANTSTGTIFRVSPAGELTTLHTFGGQEWDPTLSGARPSGLVLAGDGNMYGTTEDGWVFIVHTDGYFAAISHSLGSPSAMVRGTDGYLYGMTEGDTSADMPWSLFRTAPGGVSDPVGTTTELSLGAPPVTGGLGLGSDGSFYGVRSSDDYDPMLPDFAGYAGTICRITPAGVLTNIYVFTGGDNGSRASGHPVQSGDGNLYGTTYSGGANGFGTVYRVTKNGAFTQLYSFAGGADGGDPLAPLLLATDGNLYGTTTTGGAAHAGTVFRIGTDGAVTTLASFPPDGSGAPAGVLMQASDGALYGCTHDGGTNNDGTIFRMAPDGAFTSLYSFRGATDGANPSAALIQAGDGNLYGTTYAGGANYLGTVFRATTNGLLTSLHSFSGTTDGANPAAELVQASDGALYGTTYRGGTNDSGTIFRITASGAFTLLYSFTGGADGSAPHTGLTQGTDGNLYGTTQLGGSYGFGTVFRISTAGAFASIYSFGAVTDSDGVALDGWLPASRLVPAGGGAFYGSTEAGASVFYGTVFRITGSGILSTVNSGAIDPSGTLALAGDGNLYGTTLAGGSNDLGTVFQVTPTGDLVTLYSFTGGADGAAPDSGLLLASDGSLYGTTSWPGAPRTIFRITTASAALLRNAAQTASLHLDGSASATAAGGNLHLTISTVAGRSYIVEQNTTLASRGWVIYTNFVGDGSVFRFAVPLGKGPRFFRVRPK